MDHQMDIDRHVSDGTQLTSDYFRLIIDTPASGARNMAVDEALLESIDIPGEQPVLRLYGFKPDTLSVGRFQKTEGVIDFSGLHGDEIDFVRRPSGGQAVLHCDEITYACVIGRDHMLDFGKRAAYRLIVHILIRALEGLSLTGIRSVTAGRGSPYDPDCFAASGQYEIDDSQSRKLVGSAQMITRGGVLQHGSIPLGNGNRRIRRYLIAHGNATGERLSEAGDETRTPTADRPEPTSLGELAGGTVDFTQVRDDLAESIAEFLSVKPEKIDRAVAERADELEADKYTRDSWNRKR